MPGRAFSPDQCRGCTEPGLLTFELQRDQVRLPELKLEEAERLCERERESERGGKGKEEEGGERRGGRRERRREGGEGSRERGEREAAISSLNRAQRCRSHCSNTRAECR